MYETHSRFDCENSEMANILIEELNTYARDAHLEELRKSQGEKQPEQSEKAEGDQSVEPPAMKVMEPEEVLPPPLPTIVVIHLVHLFLITFHYYIHCHYIIFKKINLTSIIWIVLYCKMFGKIHFFSLYNQ